jgi:hypothetical protein
VDETHDELRRPSPYNQILRGFPPIAKNSRCAMITGNVVSNEGFNSMSVKTISIENSEV